MPLQCPHCQDTIALEGKPPRDVVCPTCGSTIQFDPGATGGWLPDEAAKRLGKFEFLEQLGVGSFGAVYKARDTELDRLVAVKIPRSGSIPKAGDMERFLREARSAAQLKHPGIVSLYDAGPIDGTCCLVSEFIQGSTLAERLSAKRFGFRQAAELIAEVADALDYAHRHGVIHRDLKPSNVMLDLEGRPHLMDFGLAKGAADEITMTLEGQVLGTPAYMSPEQARGEARRVDARSDLYSLGVILYELLTGELPFRGQTRMLLVQVIQDEPRPPRRLNDGIPRDLETICLKAMAKEPARRYATARDLADDLRRFLKGEPIQARPLGAWGRALRWVKRRPADAALLLVSGVAALALVGVIVGVAYSLRLQQANQQIESAFAEREQAVYFNRILGAESALFANNVRRTEQLLADCPEHFRGWEWHFLRRACHAELKTFRGHTGRVWCAAVSPDGQRLATSSLYPDQTVKVWDVQTGKVLFSLPRHPGDVFSVAFSPDGQFVATGMDNWGSKAVPQVRLWDASTGQEVRAFPGHTMGVCSLAFAADNRRLATASFDRTVRVWNTTTGRLLHVLDGHDQDLTGVAFSPDGKVIASATGTFYVTATENKPGVATLWDAETGQKLRTLRGHAGSLRGVAFSPDGQRLATAGADQTVKLWNVSDGQELLTLKGHTDAVAAVAFHPDGKRLATASDDSSIRIWDVPTGREVLTLRGHLAPALSVAFSRDGRRLLSASADTTAKLWEPESSLEALALRAHPDLLTAVAFSPKGLQLASASASGSLVIWDALADAHARRLGGHPESVWAVAFSPDGQYLASGAGEWDESTPNKPGRVTLWDVQTGRELFTLAGHPRWVQSVAISPDGKRLASGGGNGVLKLWDLTTRQELFDLRGHRSVVEAVAFSPDGNWLASAGSDRTVRVWEVASGKEVLTFSGHTDWVTAVAFSPDGKHLASTSTDGTIKLWEALSGREIHSLAGHVNWIRSLAFSPDGRRLATASLDQTVKIWDPASGQQILTLRGHTGVVKCVAFSPDGHLLVSAGDDRTVRIWDARP